MCALRVLFAIVAMLWLVTGAARPSSCDAPAAASQGYFRATATVQQLPEFGAWSRTVEAPVVFGEPMDKQILIGGLCYWSVSVYADLPERLEMWHVFYVPVSGGELMVEDPVEGTPISLKAWRKAHTGREDRG